MNTEQDNRLRVLVVEDDPDFSALLETMLQKEGYEVTCARNGEEALWCLQQARPDLITLDIHMPGQSGTLFYRTMRAKNEYRAIPVVVVTGLTRNDKDVRNAIQCFLEVGHVPSPAGYVEKHVVPEQLLEMVRRSLQVEMVSVGMEVAGGQCPVREPDEHPSPNTLTPDACHD